MIYIYRADFEIFLKTKYAHCKRSYATVGSHYIALNLLKKIPSDIHLPNEASIENKLNEY